METRSIFVAVEVKVSEEWVGPMSLQPLHLSANLPGVGVLQVPVIRYEVHTQDVLFGTEFD